MAEYYMTYNEISEELEKYLCQSKESSNICKYKAEVLAAITGNYMSSELLLRDRYICIQSMMLHFLEVACTSGLLDAIIDSVVTGTPTGFSISIGASVSVAIWELFNSVKKLDDWDFCVYMQAVTHFHKYKKFSESDLISWFPDVAAECNMHNDKWDCDYLKTDDVTCTIFSGQHIKDALESLLAKNLLKKEKENGIFVYQFKR